MDVQSDKQAGSVVLRCKDVVAGYGELPVVRDFELEVKAGEVVVLLGANGAGKTTTLLTLSGAIPSLGGEISFAGCRPRASLNKRTRAGMAFVPEERSVFRTLTCQDNLRIGKGDPTYALELFPELRARLSVKGGQLSGGEQQMVSLGRALSMRPTLLMADELSLGLAPLIVRKLLDAIRAAADRGCAVVLVEQHVRQALQIADQVRVLRRGRIELSGTAAEMSERIEEIEARYL